MKLLTLVKRLLPQKLNARSQCVFLASDLEVSFDHPGENLKLNPEDAEILFVPVTFFININTQQRFKEWDDLYSFFLVYRTGWRLTRKVGGQELAVTIKMSVTVYHQHQKAQQRCGALNSAQNLEAWLTRSYKKRHAVFGQLGLTPCDNGFSKVDFRDISDTEREAEALQFSFHHGEIDGRLTTALNPYFNVYDHYFVLDDANALCFSFELEYEGNESINDLTALAKPDIQSILQSVKIRPRELGESHTRKLSVSPQKLPGHRLD